MKHLPRKLAVIAAAVMLSTVMASGSGPESAVSMLVRQRTDIMNGYFGGHINYKEASTRIKDIEKGRLLDEDLTAMKEFFQTDIEEIVGYEITDIEITNMDDTLICAVATIVWDIDGLEGEEKLEEVYSVILEKSENSYKLVQFF